MTVGAAIAAIAVAATTVVALRSRGADAGADVRSGNALTATDCPVHQKTPAAKEPATSGDAAAFVADITLPDCTHLARGQKVVKVWRLRNVGTVRWSGYSLRRLDLANQRGQCQTIVDVPVPTTAPGRTVDISTEVTSPSNAAFCFVRFKMIDGSGHIAFPGNRPVNFQVIVD